MKKAVLTLVVLGAAGGAFAYYRLHKAAPAPTVQTAVVTRGDIADTVGATGTLQAVTTVQVGTQVSGIVQDLYADFNTLVKKGQVIARLDPSVIETQIEQARANLNRSQADLERLRVSADDARTKLKRAQELSARSLIPTTELETAQVNVRSADAQIRSAEASIMQSEASLKQNQVNLEHTVITAPIDGLVISRNVDRGQTVAASMQAPTLFVLAADLTKMQVVANLDESDVGRIRPNQHVTFHVDAYPTEEFVGTVTQVRLQPIMQQNVVTYATVIEVPNPELKLKPGMTANVNVEIARRNNAIRVPNAALRFRPTNEMYAALGQTPPDTGQGGRARGNGGGPTPRGNPSTQNQPVRSPAAGVSAGAANQPVAGTGPANQQAPAAAPAAPSTQAQVQFRGPTEGGAVPEGGQPLGRGESDTAAADGGGRSGRRNNGRASADGGGRGFGSGGGRGGANGDQANNGDRQASGSGGGRGFDRRNMTPEERDQMMQRMRARGGDAAVGGGNPQSGGRGGAARGASAGERPAQQAASQANSGATTIDALFGPLPVVESRGRVWLYVEKQLKPLPLRLGISDGQATELLEGDLEPGAEVVTNVMTGNETRPTPQGGAFPFMNPGGRQFGPGGPGGFGGGGNRGGGGGGGRGR